ncbi:MAG: ABC transporter permease [Prevotella sp.]|nr:ABC transporter permease [Prevotella sp.]
MEIQSMIGVVLLLLLLTGAVAVLAWTDHKSLWRVLKAFASLTLQLMVVGGGAWMVYRYHSLWISGLWLVAMLTLATGWCMMEGRLKHRNMLIPVAGAVTGGCLLAGGLLMWCFGSRMMVPVVGVLLYYLITAVVQMMQTYASSLRHTTAHRAYLTANGATRLETLMPSVKRALRASVMAQIKQMAQPLVVAMPTLFCGMLLGGAQPLGAVAVTLLLMAAAFVASVVATLLFLTLAERFSSLGK